MEQQPNPLRSPEDLMSPEDRITQIAFEKFEVIKDQIISAARAKIVTDYSVEKGFTYHNIEHTLFAAELIKKLNAIGEQFQLQDRVASLACEMAIWAHDVVLVKDPFSPPGEYKRLTKGESEQASLAWLNEQLANQLLVVLHDVSDEEVRSAMLDMYERILTVAQEGIIGTTPKGVLRTVVPDELDQVFARIDDATERTNLKERLMEHITRSFPIGQSSVLSISQQIIEVEQPTSAAFNITAADLFQVGTMSAEAFAKAGDGELHESSPFIMAKARILDSCTTAELEQIRFKIISHLDFQPGFVEEQWMYAQHNMAKNLKRFGSDMDSEKRVAIVVAYQELFPHFKDRIVSSLDRCNGIRERYPLLFLDPLTPGNNPNELKAFGEERKDETVAQLRGLIDETRMPR